MSLWLCFLSVFISIDPPVVGALSLNEPAFKAGLKVGDELISIENQPIDSYTELQTNLLIKTLFQSVEIAARRDDKTFVLTIPQGSGPLLFKAPAAEAANMAFGELGMEPQVSCDRLQEFLRQQPPDWSMAQLIARAMQAKTKQDSALLGCLVQLSQELHQDRSLVASVLAFGADWQVEMAKEAVGIIGERRSSLLRQLVQARTLIKHGRSQEALPKLRELESQFPTADRGSYFDALFNQIFGVAAIQVGDNQQAISAFTRMSEILEHLAPGTPLHAVSKQNLGIAYRRFGDDENALIYLNAASKFFKKNEIWALFGNVNNSLGAIHQKRARYLEAEVLYKNVVDLLTEKAPNSIFLAQGMNNLAGVYQLTGRYSQAIKWYQTALAIKKTMPEERFSVSASYNNVGALYEFLGDYPRALEYYREALKIRQEMAPDHLYTAQTQTNLGNIFLALKNLPLAQKHLDEALRIVENLKKNEFEIAKILHLKGLLFLEKGAYSQARELFRQVLDLRMKDGAQSGLHPSNGVTRLAMTRAHLALGEDELARIACQQAILELENQPGFTMQRAEGFSYMSKLSEDLEQKKELIQKSCQSVLAVNLFGLNQETGIHSTQVFLPYFYEYARLCFDQGLVLKAFLILEDARKLMARLTVERYWTFSGIPDDLAADYASYRTARNQLDRTPRNGQEYAELEREVNHKEEALYLQLAERLHQEGLNYHFEPTASSDLHRILRPNQVLLTWLPGPKMLRGIAVRAESDGNLDVQWFTHDWDQHQWNSDLWLLDHILGDPNQVELRDSLRHRIYADLLQPFAHLFQENRLVTVLADQNMRLPFAWLASTATPGRIPGLWHTAPSLNFLRQSKKIQTDFTLEWVGVAGSSTQNESMKLKDASAEVDEIQAIFTGKTQKFIGQNAHSKKALQAFSSAQIVHIAAHHHCDEMVPFRAGFILGQADEGWDGVLHSWEIAADYTVPAELVVLNGCCTGSSYVENPIPTLQTTEAFFRAGSRQIINTLWPVNDAFSKSFMLRFYHYLRQKPDPVWALKQAQEEAIQHANTADPKFWAAFQITGDPLRIQPIGTSTPWLAWGFIALGLTILGGVAVKLVLFKGSRRY